MIQNIQIDGASMIDVIYTYESPRGAISWNVTKLLEASRLGMFGPAVRIETVAVLEPDYTTGNLDRAKIAHFQRHPSILAVPAIAIGSPIGPRHLLCFADGNHRLAALWENKSLFFRTFIVPHQVEKNFRIAMTVQPNTASQRKAS